MRFGNFRIGRVRGLVFFGVVVAVLVPGALGQHAWVVQYNGPASDEERVRDMAVRDGAVYITGFATAGYWRAMATAKYSYDGEELWTRVYEGVIGPNQPDEPEALAVDAEGNVYVTGWSLEQFAGGGSSVDVVLLKYDAEGTLLWEERYRTAGGNNQPGDIVLGDDGNIYITGASWVDGAFDLLVLKYAPDGTLLWDRTAGEPGDRWDSGYAQAVDPDGNVISVGYSELIAPLDSAPYIVKHDADGNLLWERTRNGFTTVEEAEEVVIDGVGNIFVTGEVGAPADALRIWTARYSPSGNLDWERDFTGTADGMPDYAGGLALDSDGNVIVSGQSWNEPNTTSMVTLKYGSDGALVWVREETAGYVIASGEDVTVDRFGNVYTTGSGTAGDSYQDMVTVKYDPSGALLDTWVYADPNGRDDYARQIVVDPALNVFVTGDAWVGFENYYDLTTLRYRQVVLGDLDEDGDIDVGDLNAFGACLLGPGVEIVPSCARGDFDGDTDVDLADFLEMQEARGFSLTR